MLDELDDELDFELLSRSRLAIFALASGFATDPAGFSGLGFAFSCFSCFSSFSGFSGFSGFSCDFFDGGEELLELLEEFSEEELSDEEEELGKKLRRYGKNKKDTRWNYDIFLAWSVF